MRTYVRLGSVLACLAAATSASAAPTDFSAGSWIIPMDSCYQPSQPFDPDYGFYGSTDRSTIYGAHTSCPDTSSATAKDGILKAYGLIYRLLQNGVPVYYILNQNKTGVDDIDLTITSSGGTPVANVNHSTGALSEFMASSHTSISYRGAPFIISAADVPTALNLLKTNSSFTATDSRTNRGVFQDVYIHQAKTNILQAPVRAILLQTPPKIALNDLGGAANRVLQGYLEDAGLWTATAVKAYPNIGDVFTQFDNVSDFTTSNGLIAGGFAILWSPHWAADDTSILTQTQRDQITQKIAAFVDAGHPLVAQCASIEAFEGASSVQNSSSWSMASDQYGYFATQTSTGTAITGTAKALKANQLNQPDFPNQSGTPVPDGTGTGSIVVNPDTTLKAWLDPLTQTGDFVLSIDTGSRTFDYTPASGYAYKSFVHQYIMSANTGVSSTNGLDIETVFNKDGDSSKGLIIYLGGHSYGSRNASCSGGTCNDSNQYNFLGLERLVLNSLLFMGQIPTSTEQSRSAPIVYQGTPSQLDGRTYLGSYVQQTQASAAFPPWSGHFREYPVGGLAGTNVTGFNSVTSDWDSYNNIKTQSSSDARNIYTAVPIGGKMTQIAFTTANLSQIQTYGGCSGSNVTSANLTAIRTGVLGGVDHSIPAIIGPSPQAGSSSRPTVAYVGALDGMLHAILVYGSVGSYHVGDELWAFIPPSQLCKVFAQSAGVDGSPNVGDAFVDTTGSGVRAWKTLLAVPDGNYAGGTLDVLDITDPTGGSPSSPKPSFVWEASDTYTAGGKTYVLGRAQGAAMSPIITSKGVQFAFFVVTDNTNGTAGNGWNMYALDAGTGSVIWRSTYTYTKDTTHNDVPAVAAVIDAAGDSGPVTNVYFADIEGKLWSVPAATGFTGTPTPLYDAAVAHSQSTSINFPVESGIALYRDPTTQHLDILGVTGGADWVPSTTLSYIFKYDTQTTTSADVATLGVGERVYALPTISGNQAYIITSVGQLQTAIGNAFTATGSLIRINLGGAGGTTTLATVKQGASEVAVDSSGNVIAVSATGITQNTNSGRDTSQSVVSLQNATQKLLKVRAWLDWH